MRSTAKISLEKRLQELPTKQANFLRVFELPIDSYFYDWDRRFGGSYFAPVFAKEIRPYDPLYEERYLLCEAIHFGYTIPPVEYLQLFYHILIEPFGKWEEHDRKE